MEAYRNIRRCRVEFRSDEACPGTEYTGYGSLIQKYLAKPPYQCVEPFKMFAQQHIHMQGFLLSVCFCSDVVMEWIPVVRRPVEAWGLVCQPGI